MKHQRLLIDRTEVARGLEPAIYELVASHDNGLVSVRELGDDCGDELLISADRLSAVDDEAFVALQRLARKTRQELRRATADAAPLVVYRARYKMNRVLDGLDS